MHLLDESQPREHGRAESLNKKPIKLAKKIGLKPNLRSLGWKQISINCVLTFQGF